VSHPPAPPPLRIVPLLVLLALLHGCGGDKRPTSEPPAQPDSALHADTARVDTIPAAPPVAYSRVTVKSARAITALHDSLAADGWMAVLAVNRVDSTHVRVGDTLIVPSSFDRVALSPFPTVFDAVRDTAQLILVSQAVQAFGVYDHGRLVRWGPVSTGRKETPTPLGLYHTNWKDEHRLSTDDSTWVLKWYLNLHNFRGVSFHEFELPGRPASHSCVRLLEEDARWLYGWASTWQLGSDRRTILRNGTPVVVFGEWRYGRRAPWKRLPEDPDATLLTADEMADALRILNDKVRPDFSKVVGPAEGASRPVEARNARPVPGVRDSGISMPAPPHMYDSLRPPARVDSGGVR
jgi:lipoprotein-anchoring transpeptidase ErfK/SrfK